MDTNKGKWRVRVGAPRIATAGVAHWEWLTREVIPCSRGEVWLWCRWGLLLTSAVLRSAASFTVRVRNKPFSFSNNRRRFPRISTWLRNQYIIWFLTYSAGGSHRDGALPLFFLPASSVCWSEFSAPFHFPLDYKHQVFKAPSYKEVHCPQPLGGKMNRLELLPNGKNALKCSKWTCA